MRPAPLAAGGGGGTAGRPGRQRGAGLRLPRRARLRGGPRRHLATDGQRRAEPASIRVASEQ